MNLRPLHQNVLVKPVAPKRESAGGIFLPSGERTGMNRGEVVAVASGVTLVADGDIVLYERGAPTVDAGDGKVIVNIEHIAAVLA